MAPTVQAGRVPIIKLYRDLVVVVQGSLTDEALGQLQREVTQAIDRHDARGLVVDVTGVDLMDSYISRAIYDLASVARLMGVETLVCGINPDIALTLVEMGLALGGVKAELNLERALETLADLRARKHRDLDEDDDDSDDDDDDEAEPDETDEHGPREPAARGQRRSPRRSIRTARRVTRR